MTKELRKEYELVREKYNEFMEEAVELYHELNGGSFEIYKPFNEWAFRIGLDVENDYGELEQRFFTYVDNIAYEIEYEVDKCGFELRDLGNRWRVLVLKRFDQWMQDDFSSLVHRLFEMNGCFDFGNKFQQTPFEDYIRYDDFVKDRTKGGRLALGLDEFIGIFEDGLARIEDVRNNQKRMAWDLCKRLNESLSGDEIYEACDFAVRGGRPLW